MRLEARGRLNTLELNCWRIMVGETSLDRVRNVNEGRWTGIVRKFTSSGPDTVTMVCVCGKIGSAAKYKKSD